MQAHLPSREKMGYGGIPGIVVQHGLVRLCSYPVGTGSNQGKDPRTGRWKGID